MVCLDCFYMLWPSDVFANRDTGRFGVRAACRRFPEGSLLPFPDGFGRRVELN